MRLGWESEPGRISWMELMVGDHARWGGLSRMMAALRKVSAPKGLEGIKASAGLRARAYCEQKGQSSWSVSWGDQWERLPSEQASESAASFESRIRRRARASSEEPMDTVGWGAPEWIWDESWGCFKSPTISFSSGSWEAMGAERESEIGWLSAASLLWLWDNDPLSASEGWSKEIKESEIVELCALMRPQGARATVSAVGSGWGGLSKRAIESIEAAAQRSELEEESQRGKQGESRRL